MQLPRFVFLSAFPPVIAPGQTAVSDKTNESIVWLLMSPNNRGLGRSRDAFATYVECRADVARLRRDRSRVRPVVFPDDATGRFNWRVDLDGRTVAVSSRSYLRARECDYNLTRFLESVPVAEVADGARAARAVRRPGTGGRQHTAPGPRR